MFIVHALVVLAVATCPYGSQTPLSLFLPKNHPTIIDVNRARLQKPQKREILASSTQSVSERINSWLAQNHPPESFRACESFSTLELNRLFATLFPVRHAQFGAIYDEACRDGKCDSRRLRHDNLSRFEDDWIHEQVVLDEAPALVSNVVRDGKCFEIVNLFHHHLTDATRKQILAKGLELPLLPPREYSMGRRRRELQDINSGTLDLRKFTNIIDSINDPIDLFADHIPILPIAHTLQLAKKTLEFREKFTQTEWAKILERTAGQSPCTLAHSNDYSDHYEKETFYNASLDTEAPLQIQGTGQTKIGYVEQGAVCGDPNEPNTRQYSLRATIKEVLVKGSKNIQIQSLMTANGLDTSRNLSTRDVRFVTRTFEAIHGRPNSAFVGNTYGTDGILGPVLRCDPGETCYLYVQNDLDSDIGNVKMTNDKMVGRIDVTRKYYNKTQYAYFTGAIAGVTWGPGAQFEQPPDGILKGEPTNNLTQLGGPQNVPGEFTNGFQSFNIHWHGYETNTHLFHPLSTSRANAPWIQIQPKRAYCYKFEVSDRMSRGVFLYHTHMHGTATMLTWAGLFGVIMSGESSVAVAEKELDSLPKDKFSLVHDVTQFAKAQRIPFTDADILTFVQWDTVWKYPDTGNPDKVYLADFIADERESTTVNPVLVNDEYQPTFTARVGHLTLIHVACISAANLCTFQIEKPPTSLLGRSPVLGFLRVASDGISYERAVDRPEQIGVDNKYTPDVTKNLAYLSMAGGMRESILVYFDTPGRYSVVQVANAFDDSNNQRLATIEVVDTDPTPTDTTHAKRKSVYEAFLQHRLYSARSTQDIMERSVIRHRSLSFESGYRQDGIPFLQYGISTPQRGFEMYDLTQTSMAAAGGECEIWNVSSPNAFAHPFHIHVNPFQVIAAGSILDQQESIMTFWPAYSYPWTTPGTASGGVALKGIWRDTVMVPPFGYVIMKMCFDAGIRRSNGDVDTFSGKSIFHCHFLQHEDTGLMHNLFLAQRTLKATSVPMWVWIIVLVVILVVVLSIGLGVSVWRGRAVTRARSNQVGNVSVRDVAVERSIPLQNVRRNVYMGNVG
jgi:FtsP/CotA-like multicopper oxidase with cupredoxin domain